MLDRLFSILSGVPSSHKNIARKKGSKRHIQYPTTYIKSVRYTHVCLHMQKMLKKYKGKEKRIYKSTDFCAFNAQIISGGHKGLLWKERLAEGVGGPSFLLFLSVTRIERKL